MLANGEWDETIPLSTYGGSGISAHGDHFYMTGDRLWKRRMDTGEDVPTEYADAPALGVSYHGDKVIQDDSSIVYACWADLEEQWGASNPVGVYGVMRYLQLDGGILQPDSSFHWGAMPFGAYNLYEINDGRMLVSGRSTTYNGYYTGNLARIHPNGDLDTTFHSPITGGVVSAFWEQTDGKVIVGGFLALGTDTMQLIRLLPSGALDTTFHNTTFFQSLPSIGQPGDFFFNSVHSVAKLEDGSLLVVGRFTHVDGEVHGCVALLDSVGNLRDDVLFGAGAGEILDAPWPSTPSYSSAIARIRTAPDGSIFLCGAFKGFDDGVTNDTTQRNIIKLHGLSVGVQERAKALAAPRVYPNPGRDELTAQWEQDPRFSVTLLDATGRPVAFDKTTTGSATMATVDLATGAYLLRVTGANGRSSAIQWVKQ
jgi:Domain of unknown function (DUF5122) beta-propeller/Secretion system C-terminal sorting domain